MSAYMARDTHNQADPETSSAKRLKAALASFIRAPQLEEGEVTGPSLFINNPFIRNGLIDYESHDVERVRAQLKDAQEEARKEEQLAIARAELKLAKETNQKNLVLLHRSQVLSFAALIVAIAALIIR